jgi:hypothetical protein
MAYHVGAGGYYFSHNVNGTQITRTTSTGFGVGNIAPSASLHVNGSLRFVTGNQGANKILQSDASGNADWVTPSAEANTVANGKTGFGSTTAYGLIAGGTTSTGNLQNTGTGSANQVLISNGASALPSFVNQSSINAGNGFAFATLNTTSTSIATIATIATGSSEVGTFSVSLVGIDQSTGSNVTYAEKKIVYKNIGGTLTILVSTDVTTLASDDGGTWTIVASGTDILIRVTPGTTTSTNWQIMYTPVNKRNFAS